MCVVYSREPSNAVVGKVQICKSIVASYINAGYHWLNIEQGVVFVNKMRIVFYIWFMNGRYEDLAELVDACVTNHFDFVISVEHLRFSVHAELHSQDIFLTDEEVDQLISKRLGYSLQSIIDSQEQFKNYPVDVEVKI